MSIVDGKIKYNTISKHIKLSYVIIFSFNELEPIKEAAKKINKNLDIILSFFYFFIRVTKLGKIPK